LAQINAVTLFKFISKEVDQSIVKIIPTEESVTVCGFDFKDPITNLKDGNIESSSPKIKDCNFLI
jgi:hypothetical protein